MPKIAVSFFFSCTHRERERVVQSIKCVFHAMSITDFSAFQSFRLMFNFNMLSSSVCRVCADVNTYTNVYKLTQHIHSHTHQRAHACTSTVPKSQIIASVNDLFFCQQLFQVVIYKSQI